MTYKKQTKRKYEQARRFGHPRSNRERLKRHLARFGSKKLPPRGTGLQTPKIVYYPPWIPPENLIQEIKEEFKKNPNRKTASDLEAMVYLHTASLAQPLNSQACRIYFYLFRKYLKKHGWKKFEGNLSFLNQYKTLSAYDKRELSKLEEWIFKQQQKRIS